MAHVSIVEPVGKHLQPGMDSMDSGPKMIGNQVGVATGTLARAVGFQGDWFAW